MKITTQWQQGLDFIATNELGQTITMSGDGNAPSPMHMVLSAVGGCSSIDIVMILQKARQQISDCTCELKAERAETDPKVFTKIHAHYKIIGSHIKQKQAERACQLSIEKYCSVALMLNKAVEISYTFEVIEAEK
jgi:putative redox protein